MDILIRGYHGCQVESVQHPEGEQWTKPELDENGQPKEPPELVCDGWVHRLSRKGVACGEFLTLAAAIQAAKATNERLEPVGQDYDGRVKPLDELT